jgi:RNA polymerase sigma-70 factor (ECF subfamily)
MNVDSGPPRPDPGELYERLGLGLHRYALMILADVAEAEDAVHQVFEALVRRGTSGLDAPDHYLRRAVRNECLSRLRQRQTMAAAQTEHLLEPAASVDNPEERLALARALGAVPPDQREVVHLKVFEGLTFNEIAELTSESINTVASRYRYAMVKLRAALNGGLSDE